MNTYIINGEEVVAETMAAAIESYQRMYGTGQEIEAKRSYTDCINHG